MNSTSLNIQTKTRAAAITRMIAPSTGRTAPAGWGKGPESVLPLSENRQRKHFLLKLCTWNVRTLNNVGAKEILAMELHRYGILIAGIQESRLEGQGCVEIIGNQNVTRYALHYSGGTSKRNGVAIAVHSSLTQHIQSVRCFSDRVIAMRLVLKTFDIAIISAYSPTEEYNCEEKDQFYDDLCEAAKFYPKSQLIVLGDFNASTGCANEGWKNCMGTGGRGTVNDNGIRLLSFASHHNSVIANTLFPHQDCHKITWQSPDGKTEKQIDYIVVDSRLRSNILDCRSKKGADCNTDHFMVTCKLRLKHFRPQRAVVKPKPDLAQLKLPEKQLAFQTKLGNIPKADNAIRSWDSFTDKVSKIAMEVCGPHRNHRKPWISQETLTLIEEKRHAKLMKDESFNRLNRKVKRSLKNDQESWVQQQSEGLERASQTNNIKLMYDIIKTLAGKPRQHHITVKNPDGSIAASAEQRLLCWENHFTQLLNRGNPEVEDQDISDGGTFNGFSDVSDEPPTLDEVSHAIRVLKNGKASGCDGMTPELIKHGGPPMVTQIHNICVEVWKTNCFPESWKKAIIVPLHKKGSKSEPKNYRGISLLSISGKVFLTVLRHRYRTFLDSICREEQAGFRPGRSCVDQIFTLNRIIERRLLYNKPFIAIFVDFEAAFDSVHRDSMWQVLESEGLPTKIIDLLRSLYCGGGCVVRTTDGDTKFFEVTTGVRQGCITSPDLFRVTLDKALLDTLTEEEGIEVGEDVRVTDLDFADDTVFFVETWEQANRLLNKFKNSAKPYGLRINYLKTKCVMYGDGPNGSLMIDGQYIEQVDSFKYLGATSSSTGYNMEEITIRIGKAAAAFASLKPRIFNNPNISKETKLRIYRCSIIAILLYGAETWVVREEELRLLEVFHMRCLRCILNRSLLHRITNIQTLSDCDELSIREKIRIQRGRWYGHLQRMQPARLPLRVFSSTIPNNWKRKRGGQRLTWSQLLLKDYSPLIHNITMNDLEEMARSRSQWRGVLSDRGRLVPKAKPARLVLQR